MDFKDDTDTEIMLKVRDELMSLIQTNPQHAMTIMSVSLKTIIDMYVAVLGKKDAVAFLLTAIDLTKDDDGFGLDEVNLH